MDITVSIEVTIAIPDCIQSLAVTAEAVKVGTGAITKHKTLH